MTLQFGASATLAGGGEMGKLMRSIDWGNTAVGPVAQWPQSLRTALSILMETGFPMYIAWGSDFTQFYNDGYRPILGSTKHPAAMGRSTRETFSEIWELIGPMFRGVMDGKATTLVDFMLPLDRHGFAEECYFIFSYSPIRQENGEVGGVLVTVTETTARVLGERRLKTTQALAAQTRDAQTVVEACRIAGRVLEENPSDLTFARIYLAHAEKGIATLAAQCGEASAASDLPQILQLGQEPFCALERPEPGKICQLLPTGGAARIIDPATSGGGKVVAVPITHQGGDRPTGILIAGTSPRLLIDQSYCDFLTLVASQCGSAIASAKAFEDAKARSDELAKLDRAKTLFFSNVSHEFRTPLTLMLGPTQDALESPEQSLQGVELEAVHRNMLRLLKLVNTLLEFSRIEAGRVAARFEPTDLAAVTSNLASAFRSATERAGLDLIVDCPPLESPVFVDRDMWEKIVLNLLSNAFKFTFSGSIRVELRADDEHAELRVRDTGVGIAAENLSLIFDRFYRVAQSLGRTHEGSGIGLALVRELVSMHGGVISVSSTRDKGSTFTVRMPLGAAHLPSTALASAGPASAGNINPTAADTKAQPYVQEALGWLPENRSSTASSQQPERRVDGDAQKPRILVADDNADMREYLRRLLSARFVVETVVDGKDALTSARLKPPDAIISDVMMPELDGFALLAALRGVDETRAIPVILLSARANEEARIEALQAGADDYVVKPFSARELVACVEAQLVRAKLRALESANALRLANVFSHAPVGVAILRGPDHVYEFANQRYLHLVHNRPVVGKGIREAMPELEGQGIYELLDDVYRSGKLFNGQSIPIQVRAPGGKLEDRFFDFVYQPLLDDQRAISGIAVVVFDVTDLTLARREAERANRAKDEFLAMLGHELRNPLAPIMTALQLMRLREVRGAERERTIIERQARHMVSLVDDLLDISRITRGQIQLKSEPVDIADVVAKALEMTAPAIEGRKHALNVQVPRGLVVDGDAPRLAQVVANILTNAAKYSDVGSEIAISAQARNSRIEVAVADNGRGIAPEMLPGVFDLFTQEKQEIDRSEGGLGIGLAIVKSLVQGHGGTVSAHSRGKGHGATFVIRLPATKSAVRVAEEIDDPGMPKACPGLRVLIVDDNEDAASVLAESLRLLGHTTQVALASTAVPDLVATFKPDAVLLDLGLPEMDGFEVARRIRQATATAPVALVAITGYGREVDRQRAYEAGFNEHMVKPVDIDELNRWLADNLTSMPSREEEASHE